MTASIAATLIPWPNSGLNRQIESAMGTSPRGQRSSLWKCRRTLAGKPKRATSVTGFAVLNASQAVSVRRVRVKATKLSMSLGISPPGRRPSETSQRPFSIGRIKAPRPSPGGIPKWIKPIQSREASDGSKMALA